MFIAIDRLEVLGDGEEILPASELREAENLKCKIISQLYYSITKIAVYGNIPSILLNALQNKTMKIMKDFDVFGVVQVIYAHAKLSIRVKEPLRMKMIQFISENSSKFNGQDVANT